LISRPAGTIKSRVCPEGGIATIGAKTVGRPGSEAVPERLKDAGDGRALDALRPAAMAIDQKVPPVESAEARAAREQAAWEENERRWRDPMADHWWTPWPTSPW
jgi:hypothetical protein